MGERQLTTTGNVRGRERERGGCTESERVRDRQSRAEREKERESESKRGERVLSAPLTVKFSTLPAN